MTIFSAGPLHLIGDLMKEVIYGHICLVGGKVLLDDTVDAAFKKDVVIAGNQANLGIHR